MGGELHDVGAFYASRGGRVAARLLRRQLLALWPDLHRQRVLGLGHTQPFLSLWERQATACVAGETEARRETGSLASASCLVQGDALPFVDLSFDRILLGHALETAPDPARLLRQVWRVLKDDGRLLLVVPNRRGLWAHVENTPFGQGAPASRRQVERLLSRSLFRAESSTGALWLPPLDWRPLLRMGTLAERAGSRVAPRFAGVLLIEAVKDVHAAMPAGRRVMRRVLLPAG